MSDQEVGIFLLFLPYIGGVVAIVEFNRKYEIVKRAHEASKFIIGNNGHCESRECPDRAEILRKINSMYPNIHITERKDKNRNKANETRQLNLHRFRKAPILMDKQFFEVINEIEID